MHACIFYTMYCSLHCVFVCLLEISERGSYGSLKDIHDAMLMQPVQFYEVVHKMTPWQHICSRELHFALPILLIDSLHIYFQNFHLFIKTYNIWKKDNSEVVSIK